MLAPTTIPVKGGHPDSRMSAIRSTTGRISLVHKSFGVRPSAGLLSVD